MVWLAALGDLTETDEKWLRTRDFAREKEAAYQKECDVFEFLLIWESKILPRFRQQAEAFVE